MQPNSEPTAADVALVAEAMGQTSPQPVVPAPAPVVEAQPQMQPAPVTPQPSPTSQTPSDPFASLFATPTEPTAPVAPVTQPTEPMTPQPQQPTEPTQPAPVTPAPTAPTEPVAPVTPPVDDYQTYDDYMKATLAGIPAAPELPDAEQIDPNNPQAIKTFFDELVNTAVVRAEANSARKTAIQQTERKLWDESFDKFGTLRDNKGLRDMVHNIRMGYFNRGIAITPTQAAEKLLESLGSQYKQGVADSAVVTTIEDSQPNGGGTGAPVATSLDHENVLTAIQTGGEQALAAYLDGEVKAGRM